MESTISPPISSLGDLLEQYFDKVYVINLGARQDRWTEISQHLMELGFRSFERVEAVDGSLEKPHIYTKIELPFSMRNAENREKIQQGHLGCYLSHLKVLRLAKQHWNDSPVQEKPHRVLILEDDCCFDATATETVRVALKEIGDHCQVLMLGANHQKPPLQCDNFSNIVKVQEAFGAHAYGLDSHLYDRAIRMLESKLEGPSIPPIDVVLTTFQKEGYCYATNPLVADQRPGWSDIEQRRVDHRKYFRVGTYIDNWVALKIACRYCLSKTRAFALSVLNM